MTVDRGALVDVGLRQAGRHAFLCFGLGFIVHVCACSVTLDPTLSPGGLSEADATSNSDSSLVRDAFSGSTDRVDTSPGRDALAAIDVDAGGFADSSSTSACVSVQGPDTEYLICVGPLTADEAVADCAIRGGSLAAIPSADENALLYAQASLDANSNLWLGGRRDDAQLWSWPDGTAFWSGRYDGMALNGLYSNWKAGEPNNSSTVTTEPEACMVMSLTDGGWNDRACSLALAYICQRSLRASP